MKKNTGDGLGFGVWMIICLGAILIIGILAVGIAYMTIPNPHVIR